VFLLEMNGKDDETKQKMLKGMSASLD